jgi:hypothetical protein
MNRSCWMGVDGQSKAWGRFASQKEYESAWGIEIEDGIRRVFATQKRESAGLSAQPNNALAVQ